MFAGQRVTSVPRVSKGVGRQENLFGPRISLASVLYSNNLVNVRKVVCSLLYVPVAISVILNVKKCRYFYRACIDSVALLVYGRPNFSVSD
jgi:hypothetical protein